MREPRARQGFDNKETTMRYDVEFRLKMRPAAGEFFTLEAANRQQAIERAKQMMEERGYPLSKYKRPVASLRGYPTCYST